jgi:hypothetical protein
MIIHILNRNEFKFLLSTKYNHLMEISEDPNLCYISIHNWNDTQIESDSQNYLNLWFDDITEKETKFVINDILFTEEHAKQIIEFCENNSDKRHLYVHCTAGISRSGAVGLFINDNWGTNSYESFMRNHPWIHPNPYVSRILNQIFKGTPNDQKNTCNRFPWDDRNKTLRNSYSTGVSYHRN